MDQHHHRGDRCFECDRGYGDSADTGEDRRKTDEGYSYEESYEVDDRDPYESITKGIPETGESAEYTLTSGLYIVGVHIPEGVYQAETEDEFDVVSVHNSELNLYLYEYEGKDGENYLDDLRLYEGSRWRSMHAARSFCVHRTHSSP